ncbi:hypothetical protein GGR53DRAFT_76035 [Hypoxylon sp. FL1150]|nr:hypothetical protein GGR53DRAFT_76035 [Hypoxylon sp. FL1150]
MTCQYDISEALCVEVGERSQIRWAPSAACVRPNTAEEAAEALRIISQPESQFAIRAIGHNPNPGFSGADETSLVINLCNLDHKSIDGDGIFTEGMQVFALLASSLVVRFPFSSWISAQYPMHRRETRAISQPSPHRSRHCQEL